MIPATAYFIWFGPELSWMHALSIRSAVRNGGFANVILYHDRQLSGAGFDSLPQDPRLEFCLIDWNSVADKLPEPLRPVVKLANSLNSPAAKANVLRAMLLAAEGGVYLDTDFITLRSFGSLCRDTAIFFGREIVAFPADVVQGTNLPRKVLALLHTTLRDVFRRLPSGWRAFRSIEKFYPQAANNAILGSERAHPFVLEMLRRMLMADERQVHVRYALGTHLLQRVAKQAWPQDVVSCPPATFYPLGPEISEHWFRTTKALPALDEVLLPDTIGVHWYASVRTKALVSKIGENYIFNRQKSELFSALVARALGQ